MLNLKCFFDKIFAPSPVIHPTPDLKDLRRIKDFIKDDMLVYFYQPIKIYKLKIIHKTRVIVKILYDENPFIKFEHDFFSIYVEFPIEYSIIRLRFSYDISDKNIYDSIEIHPLSKATNSEIFCHTFKK